MFTSLILLYIDFFKYTRHSTAFSIKVETADIGLYDGLF